MDDFLAQDDTALLANAFVDLAEVTLSPVSSTAWEAEVDFLHCEEDHGDTALRVQLVEEIAAAG